MKLIVNNVNIEPDADGFINATELCKICNKNFKFWMLKKQSKDIIKFMTKNGEIVTKVINKNTWVNVDIAIIILQWISVEFLINCIREIKDEIIINIDLPPIKLPPHKNLNLYKLKNGVCIYIADDNIGWCKNINDKKHRNLQYVIYSDDACTIYKLIKCRFKNNINIEEIVNYIQNLGLTISELSRDEIVAYNNFKNKQRSISFSPFPKEGNIKFKRCPGNTHKDEENRILLLENFSNNKRNKDGLQRLCRECIIIAKCGENRKKRSRKLATAEFDSTTHKFCIKCGIIYSINDFYKDKTKKDGLHSLCKQCKKNKSKND
jgi:hypothetical protein